MLHIDNTGIAAGIDIGSRSIELVVLSPTGEVTHQAKAPTTFAPLRQCRDILMGVGVRRITATGYGRKLFAESGILNPCDAITEIQAYALGAARLYLEARTILDIGGQDTKVISLGPEGRVLKFEMNDRCAAGTGKFLEIMATSLQVPIEEFGDFALTADKQVQISSMCAVFAESEATSLMGRGEQPQNIALGLHLAIVERTVAMLNRVGLEHPLCFAGGVAHNRCVIRLLEERLKTRIIVPTEPDMVGALGAARYCLRKETGQ
ncbi:acyl-CoA dehydratase activase [Desulfonatronum sp. SC1]|uniref:acyl-CoA dehydratase activase n=1 Tax=Desulfonatronum sp. SC1 TaxID=2109626 RepID=UPI000D30EBBD|nr:acyl-CoA dehydratase activase [Desulfonatronum sp. SC1]PTN32253.1 3-hydroxyacyl-ACP dehydratase [Desulfonatronum sp. SC1]